MIHLLKNEKNQLLRLRQNSVTLLVLPSRREMLSAEDTRTGTITAMSSELFNHLNHINDQTIILNDKVRKGLLL